MVFLAIVIVLLAIVLAYIFYPSMILFICMRKEIKKNKD